VDHVINFNAIHKLSIISHLCLNSVKLTVKFLQIRECS